MDALLDQQAERSVSAHSTMPAIFVAHGNPMNALAHNLFTDRWADPGNSIPRPKAILSISAHWYVPEAAVTAASPPRRIHEAREMLRAARFSALVALSFPVEGFDGGSISMLAVQVG